MTIRFDRSKTVDKATRRAGQRWSQSLAKRRRKQSLLSSIVKFLTKLGDAIIGC